MSLEPHQLLAAEQRNALIREKRAAGGWWTYVDGTERVAYDALPLEELMRLARHEARSRKRPRAERVARTRESLGPSELGVRPPRPSRKKRFVADAAKRLGAGGPDLELPWDGKAPLL